MTGHKSFLLGHYTDPANPPRGSCRQGASVLRGKHRGALLLCLEHPETGEQRQGGQSRHRSEETDRPAEEGQRVPLRPVCDDQGIVEGWSHQEKMHPPKLLPRLRF